MVSVRQYAVVHLLVLRFDPDQTFLAFGFGILVQLVHIQRLGVRNVSYFLSDGICRLLAVRPLHFVNMCVIERLSRLIAKALMKAVREKDDGEDEEVTSNHSDDCEKVTCVY